jgi:hypothetical protein
MEVEKMKRFLSVFLFVVLSIFVAPMFSDHYSALAGRTLAGGAAGEYCDCNESDPPCYYDNSNQLCNGDGNLQTQAPTPVEKSTKSTSSVDPTSLGLMIFAAAYLFRRFIL